VAVSVHSGTVPAANQTGTALDFAVTSPTLTDGYAVVFFQDNNGTVTSVNYDGQAMTQLRVETREASIKWYAYGIPRPNAGSVNVTVNKSSSATVYGLSVVWLENAQSSAAADSTGWTAYSNVASKSVSVTTVASNVAVVGFAVMDNGNITASTDTTLINRATSGDANGVGTFRRTTVPTASPSTVSMAVTGTAGSWSAFMAVGIGELVAASFSVSDTCTASETVTSSRARLFSILDTATLSEVVTAARGIAFSALDTITGTDTFTSVRARIFSALDTVTASEVVARARLLWTNASRAVTDWTDRTRASTNWTNRSKS
jgi:hypothetical protein